MRVWSGRAASRRAVVGVALLAALALTACSGDDDPTAGPSASESPTVEATAGTTAPLPEPTPTTPPPGPTGGVTAAPPEATPVGEAGELPATQEPGSTTQEVVLQTLPGDPTGACVDTTGQRDVRSGGMGAGAFDDATKDYADSATSPNVELHWIPLDAADLTGLTVRGTQLTGGSATFTYEQDESSEVIGDTGTWHYYLTAFEIPAPGQWRLEATSGSDSGCFTVTFQR